MSKQDAQTGHNRLRRAKVRSEIVSFEEDQSYVVKVYMKYDAKKPNHYIVYTVTSLDKIMNNVLSDVSSFERIK